MGGSARFTEDRQHEGGNLDTLGHGARVLEKLADATDGGRQFRVRMISSGESLNKRLYPEAVLHAAANLYEGARVFDGHRTDAALATSSVGGLVGTVHTVEAVTGGLDATLHLIDTPAAKNVAAVLDASLAGEALHRPPLAGLSHDVMMQTRRTSNGIAEATRIDRVLSVDVVADPAAGGRAQRALAGGQEMNLRALLDKLAKAVDDAARKAILGTDEAKGVLEAAGITEADALTMVAALTPPDPAAKKDEKSAGKVDPDPAAKVDPPAADEKPAGAEPEPVAVAAESLIGKAMIREALEGLPGKVAEAVRAKLPAKFTEAELTARVDAAREMARVLEKADTGSSVGEEKGATVQITEGVDRKLAALDAFWQGSPGGYPSLKAAWWDICHGGESRSPFDPVDLNRHFMRESAGGFDSGDRPREAYSAPWSPLGDVKLDPKVMRQRSVESLAAVGDASRGLEAMIASSWNLILGDSVTRRMVADYRVQNLNWRNVVSNVQNLADFRTQRIDRLGGYATNLPTVAEAAPYQPLTSPTNEEVTYVPTKRGGTESITLEMIANDDMRAVQLIPQRLARSAAWTLYHFVWDMVLTNAVVYDGLALFTGGHSNTTSTALSTTAVETARANMRRLAAYGNTSEILGLTPKFLITGSTLETLAWQICTSAVALPSAAPVGAAANNPNIHQGMTPVVVDYMSSQTAWYLMADPNDVPTIEVGFYQGRDVPELFTQNDPTVGSMFNNDTVTYKIRHIYGAAVLDYRGLSRGNS